MSFKSADFIAVCTMLGAIAAVLAIASALDDDSGPEPTVTTSTTAHVLLDDDS